MMSVEQVQSNGAPRLCREDNWTGQVLEPAAFSVRWANRRIESRFDWDWSKWHYSEGNGSFTACGRPVLVGATDGPMFPQTFPTLEKVTCRACLAKMAMYGIKTE